jgi:D-alanyl-D-alanine carboxypeptidase/D-alanyl-D-alanine-endopeptidase (penicillin-binding protein 4)
MKNKPYLRPVIYCLLTLVFLSPVPGLAQSWTDRIKTMAGSGAVLVLAPDGKVVYSQNADIPLMPASTLKVATCAAALATLGPDYRFLTDFRLSSEGDLYIVGHGDPYLISEELAGIARTLKAKGLSRVRNVIVDNSFFQPGLVLDGTSRSLQPYDAYNGALCVNFNTINARIDKKGQISSAEPQTPLTDMARELAAGSRKRGAVRFNLAGSPKVCLEYAGDLFKAFLEAADVPVEGGVLPAEGDSEKIPLYYRHKSTKPLSWLIGELMEYSNNFMTNQIFLTMGAEKYGPPATPEKSRRVMAEFFKAGDMDAFHMEEGSGLSRNTKVTALQMAQVLDVFLPYRHLLTRKGTADVKTGTLRDVNSMVGYIDSVKGAPYKFVILLNGNHRYDTRDRILELMVDNLN